MLPLNLYLFPILNLNFDCIAEKNQHKVQSPNSMCIYSTPPIASIPEVCPALNWEAKAKAKFKMKAKAKPKARADEAPAVLDKLMGFGLACSVGAAWLSKLILMHRTAATVTTTRNQRQLEEPQACPWQRNKRDLPNGSRFDR